MVKIEQETMKLRKNITPVLQEVRFENPRLTTLGIEPMALSKLRSKVTAALLAQPQRVDFFMLMLVTEGTGRHTVDFVEWQLKPGSLVFVRPGQVQQWHLADPFSAQLILIAPSTLPHRSDLALPRELALLAFDEWATCIELNTENISAIESGVRLLCQDFDQFFGNDMDIALIRHELMTLLLRVAKQQKGLLEHLASPRVSRLTYRLFLQALEANFPQQHGLQYYAKRLGYSESTISRACVAAEGRSAKQIIDRRIALEAQRLLVHSTTSIAEIAYQLGFSESTNFVKFFRRHIGSTPSKFRQIRLPSRNEPNRQTLTDAPHKY